MCLDVLAATCNRWQQSPRTSIRGSPEVARRRHRPSRRNRTFVGFKVFLRMGFHTMKHNRDPESKPKLQATQGKLMWKPPEYSGPCFNLHFDRFDRFLFEAEPFENVRHRGLSSTVAGVSFKLCCCMEWQRKQKRIGDHFFGVENSKKRVRNPEFGSVWCLSIGRFPEDSENGRILGLHFGVGRTTFELIFGIAQFGRGATISSAT